MDKYYCKMNALTINDLYWKKAIPAKEIASRYGASIWSLYDFMKRNNITRRSYSEANYFANRNKPQYNIKKTLNNVEHRLKIAGIMLYWAEGTQKGCTVDFANSNPKMVKIFLRFLREICGVNESRLRLYLYAYSYQDLKKLKLYWHDVTCIPLDQFTKPYVRKGTKNHSGRKLVYGLVHIRYNDKRLLELIQSWIKEYIVEITGEVPERSNGPDCVERSVLKKFRMEKRVNSGEPLTQKC